MIKQLIESLRAPESSLSIADVKSDKWQRLSPLSIIYFVIKHIFDAIKNGIQTIAIAPAAIIATTGDNRWIILAVFALASSIALIVISVVSFFKFRFRIEGDKFLIRSGVFVRKRLSLSFDRIQNVGFREPIYFRPFGLIIMGLESAGSSSEEVSLGGVPRALGQAIRKHILEYKSREQTSAKEPLADAQTSDVHNMPQMVQEELLKQPVPELVRYGISNNNVWVFAGIGAALLSQIDNWWESAFFIDTFDTAGAVIGTGFIAVTLLIIAGAILILSLMMMASVVGAIIVNYNYHLTYTDGRFHRTRGLLERQETSLPKVKIQNITIAQPLIAKLLQRSHITVGQIGFKGKKNNSRGKKFIIPSVQTDFTDMLTRKLYGDTSINQTKLNGISKKFITRHVLFSVLPIALIVAGFWVYPLGWLALIPLFAPLLALPIITLRWKRYGYANDKHVGLVQSGFFGHQRTVFPFHKVQSIRITRTPGQMRSGLATLEIMLAGKTITIPYMPYADANLWRDSILYVVETTQKPWM